MLCLRVCNADGHARLLLHPHMRPYKYLCCLLLISAGALGTCGVLQVACMHAICMI